MVKKLSKMFIKPALHDHIAKTDKSYTQKLNLK